MAASRLSRWGLLLAATLATILRAPVYFTAPSFWAEEGTLYFVVAWERPLSEALVYRPAGYLLVWANLATVLAARLVRGGLLSLVHAPQVTVLFALLAQLLPVAVIAWSRAPFWDGGGRRAVGVLAVLVGVVTDEIWLNTINSQPWLLLAAVLLVLEPAVGGRARAWATAAVLAAAALTAPATAALLPLFGWRAWRTPTRATIAHTAVLAACAVVQVWCVWAAIRSGQPLPPRTGGLDVGVFAATVWMRTLVLPLLGVGAATEVGKLLARSGPLGPLSGVGLLALAGVLIAWLARGLRREVRVPLVGAYVLVTTLTLLTAVGDKAMLIHDAWASSRYVYVPGVLVLLMLLGCVRLDAGIVRPVLCGVLLALTLAHGALQFRSSVRWRPYWPSWPAEVHAWQADPRMPLAIWPPPRWAMVLSPASQTKEGS